MSARQGASFTARVLDVVRDIPRGEVLTYREVARRAGSFRASRAVGSIMKANRSGRVPCHRVVRSDGRIGEYNRGQAEKVRRLRGEGVIIGPSLRILPQ